MLGLRIKWPKDQMDGVLGNFSFGIYSSVNTVFLNIFCEFFFSYEPPTVKFAISEQV